MYLTLRISGILTVVGLLAVSIAGAAPSQRPNAVGLTVASQGSLRAPVLGPALTVSSLGDIKAPVRIVVGSKGDPAIPDVNARRLAAANSRSRAGGSPRHHPLHVPRDRNFVGRFVARQFCVDPDDVDRVAIHRKVSADALKFFHGALKIKAPGNARAPERSAIEEVACATVVDISWPAPEV